MNVPIIKAILDECKKQKGNDNYDPTYWLTLIVEEVGELAKAIANTGDIRIGNIIGIREGYDREDYESMKIETIQIAALSLAFIEYLDDQLKPIDYRGGVLA